MVKKCIKCGEEKVYPTPTAFGVGLLLIQLKYDYIFKEGEFDNMWDNWCINCALEYIKNKDEK